MPFRIDIGSLRKPERLADGRVRVDAYLTRTGVFEYRDANGGVRREYRPATEVFKADSVASFADSPLTDDHPPEMVNAGNWKNHAVGHLSGAPRQDGAHVAATIVVSDASTIAKMDAGKVQLSCGYECDLDPRPGQTPDGERYDAIQTNIRGNHVALVDVGRAGPSARVRMDALTMITEPAAQKKDTMTEDELKAALATEKARADALQARIDAFPPKSTESDDEDEEDGKKVPAFLKKKMAKKDEQVNDLTVQLIAAKNAAADQKLRADKLEAARTDDAKASLAAARARISLEDKAKHVLGAEFKADASDRDLMTAVIKRVDGEDVDATASPDFVRGLYAGAARRHDAGGDALAAVRVAATPSNRADDSAFDEEAAARKMNADSANAWKTKESK